jgi:hypothetical protein
MASRTHVASKGVRTSYGGVATLPAGSRQGAGMSASWASDERAPMPHRGGGGALASGHASVHP